MKYINIINKLQKTIGNMHTDTQLSIAVISGGYTELYGLINKNGVGGHVNNSTSAFEIGSVTKAFTGNVLAQLVVESKVKLDDAIADYLPFTLFGNPAITLKQLALHTSGLERMPHDFDTRQNMDKSNPYKNYNEEQLAEYFTEKLHMDSRPGEKYQYSNLGYALLGYIVSRIEGEHFENVVVKRIFEPLQMRQSTFGTLDIKTELVKGMDENGNICDNWDGGAFSGAIGIISTIEDMCKFAIMSANVINKASTLQSSETFLVEPQMKSNLGWGERLITPGDICMQGINGGSGGYGASVLVNRKLNCSVVALSNIWPWHYMEKVFPLVKELFIQVSFARE